MVVDEYSWFEGCLGSRSIAEWSGRGGEMDRDRGGKPRRRRFEAVGEVFLVEVDGEFISRREDLWVRSCCFMLSLRVNAL